MRMRGVRVATESRGICGGLEGGLHLPGVVVGEVAEGVLEVPVSVSLRSQTQALDETFPARLEAKSAYRAELSHTFAPGTWSGGFRFTEVTSLNPELAVSTGPLSLSLVLWEGGSQGSLTTEVVSQPRPGSSSAKLETWPGALASSEPASLALFGIAAGACGALRRRGGRS